MALDFPSSPTNGQQFINGSVIYTYSTAGGAWIAAPLGTAEPFNYLVNPSFLASNQNGQSEGTVTGYYPADQWVQYYVASGASAGAMTTGPVSPYNNPQRAVLRCITAKAALAASGDYWLLQQAIEGNRIAPWRFGSASAKDLVLRFRFKSNAANTFSFCLRNGGLNRSYVKTFAAIAGEAEYSFAIPGDTTGTWAVDETVGVFFAIALALSANYQGVNGAWNAGSFLGAAGCYNGLAANTNTYQITDIGLYRDPLKTGRAPPYEMATYGPSKLDSYRYWHKCYGANGVVTSTTTAGRLGMQHPAEMRAAPAITMAGTCNIYDGVNSIAITTLPQTYPNERYTEFNPTGTTTTLTAGRCARQSYASSMDNYIAVNARM